MFAPSKESSALAIFSEFDGSIDAFMIEFGTASPMTSICSISSAIDNGETVNKRQVHIAV